MIESKMPFLPSISLFAIAIFGSSMVEAGQPRWAQLSPFTDVVFGKDNRVVVEYEKARYELVSIDDLTTPKILKSARKQFDDRWKKRFAEDLVEVLAGMGKMPGNTVKLVLKDLQTSKTKTIANAPMTAANRQAVWKAIRGRLKK